MKGKVTNIHINNKPLKKTIFAKIFGLEKFE